MTNAELFSRYNVAELEALAIRADRAAQVHHNGGRPYMASLCETRATELRVEAAKAGGGLTVAWIESLKAEGYAVATNPEGFYRAFDTKGWPCDDQLCLTESDAWQSARKFRNWSVNVGQPGAIAKI